jgi:hypothetical protein
VCAARLLSDTEIADQYASGVDSDTIGLRAGCSGTTILKIVRALGGEVRGRGGRNQLMLPISDSEIVRRYEAGESGPRLAREADCVSSSIYNVLRKAGVRPRPRTNKRRAGRFAG